MRTLPWIVGLAVLLVPATNAVPAGDAEAARSLVDKAIRAHGGEAALSKWPASAGRLKGTFHGFGDAVPFTGEFAAEGSDRSMTTVNARIGGDTLRLVQILNRDKGWTRTNDTTETMDKEELAEVQEEAYAAWVATLVPLKDKAVTLTRIGEVTIDRRPASGIRVARKGRREVNLYFDNKTGLLVKMARRMQDELGEEVTEETFMSDYKDVQGTKQAHKLTIKRDGQPYMESQITEVRLAERLDDSVFAKP
jgi:hypothetical protein